MSSRVLKKLQGGRDADLKAKITFNDEELSDEDKDDIERGRSNHLNSFDLLNQSLSESEFKEDDNETEHASAAANLPAATGASKKKKKKRRKKTRNTGHPISSEDNEIADKYLLDLDEITSNNVCELPVDTVPVRNKLDKSLLQVELKNLNSQNELRRTFGKRVVKMDNKRGRQKLTLKNTYMVTAKDSWPPAAKNIITMKPENPAEQQSTAAGSTSSNSSSSAGDLASSTSTSPTSATTAAAAKTISFLPDTKEQWFVFEHSQYYQCIQKIFLNQVSEAELLMDLILRCPYHVDSLIQLNELCRLTEDFSMGADFIERALFVMEHSLHPSFSLTSGTSRLDYRRQENRAFFLVLFKHAVYLEERACSRTALELAKLLLTLSPVQDPLAMVLVIDYFALRSKQFNWFIRFYEEYDAVRNLSQLPNMAYSYALALFCVTEEQKSDAIEDLQQRSDKALQYALLMFPSFLRKLLDVLSIQTDKRVIACSYFNSDDSNAAEGLNMLIGLYVKRAKVIWRQSNMLPWLERNVHTVIDRVERDDPIIVEYRQKRATRYMSPPLAILRHLVLAGEKIPQRIIDALPNQTIAPYDPLPPPDSINCYERQVNKPSTSSSNSGQERERWWLSFFESALPSYSLWVQGSAQRAAGGGGGGGAAQANDVPPPAFAPAIANAAAAAGGAGAAAAAGVPVPPLFVNLNANDQEQQQRRNEAQADEEAAVIAAATAAADADTNNVLNEVSLTYRELTQTLANLTEALRVRFTNVGIGGEGGGGGGAGTGAAAGEANDNHSSDEDIVVYLDESSD